MPQWHINPFEQTEKIILFTKKVEKIILLDLPATVPLALDRSGCAGKTRGWVPSSTSQSGTKVDL